MKKIILPVLVLGLIGLVLFVGCDFFINKKLDINISTVVPNVIHIKSSEMFNETVLNSDTPSIVKFETKWCGACKTMAPIYESLASKYLNKIKFTIVEADKLSELSDKYQIQGVPTFIFFKDGNKIDQIIGAVSKEEFEKTLKQLL